MKKTHSRLDAIEVGNPQSRQLLPEFKKVSITNSPAKTAIKIDLEYVQNEMKYWESPISP